MRERKIIKDHFTDKKVVMVTGGLLGIGRAVVKELCKEDAAAAFTRTEAELGEAEAKRLTDCGYHVLSIRRHGG